MFKKHLILICSTIGVILIYNIKSIFMKTMKQTLLGFTLSVLSISAVAQCPTSMSVSIISNTNVGDLTVSQLFSASTSTTSSMYNAYSLYGSSTNYYANSFGFNSTGTFSNIPSGTYTLCVNDSIYCGGTLSSLFDCTTVTITNTIVAPPSLCNSSFTYYMDSACVTHFINTSTGSNLSYDWFINGVTYTIANPIASLSNGSYMVVLANYSSGVFCDSVSQLVTITCNGGGTVTPLPCNASFNYHTDSLCNTYFNNTSTGSNLNSYWTINGNYYSGYDQTLQLPNGNYNVSLFNYSGGSFCDSTSQMVTIACNGGTINPTACQANASFLIFTDSINSGNYFAYNMSSGTGVTSYLWNFGDGSTSTQQYPFHQYTAPGHYIVCLTVTATNGTTTCTDSYCDSSSVQRVAAGFLMHQINVIPQGTTGVKENTLANGLKTYPNPIIDELTIEIELSSTVSNYIYTMVDALGKVIMKNNIKDPKTVINTSGLDKGFYFLSISTLDGKVIKTSKLVK